jgi:hypothetical protein
MDTILGILVSSLIALNAADATTTRLAIANGAREMNPVMTAMGPAGSTVAKAGTTALTVHLTRKMKRRQRLAILITANALMAAVVVNNTRAL